MRRKTWSIGPRGSSGPVTGRPRGTRRSSQSSWVIRMIVRLSPCSYKKLRDVLMRPSRTQPSQLGKVYKDHENHEHADSHANSNRDGWIKECDDRRQAFGPEER